MSQRIIPRQTPAECDCDTCTFLDGTCPECKAGNHIRCENHGIAAIDGKVCPCTLCESVVADAEDDRRAEYES